MSKQKHVKQSRTMKQPTARRPGITEVATGPAADAARWHGDEQVTRAEVNYNKAANSAAARHHTTQQLEDHWRRRRPGGPGSVQVKLTRMTRLVTVAAATMAGGGVRGGSPLLLNAESAHNKTLAVNLLSVVGPNPALNKTCQTVITDNEAANSAAARHQVATGPAADRRSTEDGTVMSK